MPTAPSFHFDIGRSEQCTAVNLPGFVTRNLCRTIHPYCSANSLSVEFPISAAESEYKNNDPNGGEYTENDILLSGNWDKTSTQSPWIACQLSPFSAFR